MIPEGCHNTSVSGAQSQRVQIPRKEDGSDMGSLRKMPRETVIVAPVKIRLAAPPDFAPIRESLETFIKATFQHEILSELQKGCSMLVNHLSKWGWRCDGGPRISYDPSDYRKWLDELIDSGLVVGNNGVYWLPEQVPPSEQAITLYWLIPKYRGDGVSAARLAKQMGVTVESVEVWIKEIQSGFGRNVHTTSHQTPRYYRWP
jgi:hypothetical protein